MPTVTLIHASALPCMREFPDGHPPRSQRPNDIQASMALSGRILDLLFGRPLATSEERAEHIGPIAGIPIFGLDALSSAAYGPEAALTLLIVLGLGAIPYIVPISFAIIGLLAIVYV